jgi:hypothetical protein
MARTKWGTSERSQHRHYNEAMAEFRSRPDVQAILREIRRKQKRRKWPGLRLHTEGDWWWLGFLCGMKGRELGGRPPADRRCTKRLGSRLCWNWREGKTDRCLLHRTCKNLVKPRKTPVWRQSP